MFHEKRKYLIGWRKRTKQREFHIFYEKGNNPYETGKTNRREEKEADEIIGICLEAYVTHAFGGRTLSDKGCPDEYEKADRQDDLEMIPEHEKLIPFCEKVETKKSGV